MRAKEGEVGLGTKGSWFRFEGWVLANEDEAAPEIGRLLGDVLDPRDNKIVVYFGAPEDEDERHPAE